MDKRTEKLVSIELQRLKAFEDERLPQTPTLATIEELPEEREESLELLRTNHNNQRKGSKRLAGKISNRPQAWRKGLSLALKADGLALVLVLILLLVAAFGTQRNGIEATLFQGDCKKTKLYSTLLHLLINIISTILLATSSYAMQLLTSPTRADVIKTHSRGNYVNIGVPSPRNLLHFNWRRGLLYFALVTTSVPIHLLLNSAVYINQGTNSYFLFAVNYDWSFQRSRGRIDDSRLNSDLGNGLAPYLPSTYDADNDTTLVTAFRQVRSNMIELTLEQCVEAYSQPFISDYRHVIVVTDRFANISNGSLVGSSFLDVEAKFVTVAINKSDDDPTTWTCPYDRISHRRTCSADNVTSLLNPPHVGPNLEYTIKSCLAEEVLDSCKLQSNLLITAIVFTCALSKTVLLFAALRSLPGRILATLGDAIAFFLERPEPLTVECSLLSRMEVKNSWRAGLFTREGHDFSRQWHPGQSYPAKWRLDSLKDRWFQAIPGWTILSTLAFVLPVYGILFHVLVSTIDKAATIRDLGFGNANINYIVHLPEQNSSLNLMGKAVLVNLPQFVLSCYYFCYNQCWTYIFMSKEWTRFGTRAKHLPLRVSEPEGDQKSKYFLSIPHRYSIPLLVFSAALHWLASQSLFLVVIDVKFGEPFITGSTSTLSAVGYSRTAIIVLLVVFSKLVVILVYVAIHGRVRSPIPLVGGCSLAISAACHSPAYDVQCWLRPLRWGVIDSMEKDGFLHCALTSRDAYSPDQLERLVPRYHGKTWTAAWFK